MSKISFNPKAFGIAENADYSDERRAERERALIARVPIGTDIKSLFEGLGFTNVENFPPSPDIYPANDVYPRNW